MRTPEGKLARDVEQIVAEAMMTPRRDNDPPTASNTVVVIKSLSIDFIALVKNPCIYKFAFTDLEKGIVCGVLLLPDVVDMQGHRVESGTIDATVVKFCKAFDARICNFQFRAEHEGPVLDDVCVYMHGVAGQNPLPPGMEKIKNTIPDGAWWMAIHCGPETCERIAKGQLRGFSLDGQAIVQDEDGDEREVSVQELLAAIVGGVKAGLQGE